MLIVLALIGVLTSLAIPQLIAERRLSRSVGITREIQTQLRLTRQLAMSQRQAFTFQYDDSAKQISIIDNDDNPGAATLINGWYPNNIKRKVISAIPLVETVVGSEIRYGIPSPIPNGPLDDGIGMTPLVNNQLNITFQPDGSVIDSAGDPQGRAMFIYNSQLPLGTASAISVMGAAGRVKIWRYDAGAKRYAD
jgi:Tfp pilus assembly protein FimT